MFKPKERSEAEMRTTNTVLSEGITIKDGDMTGNGSVRIDGVFFGNIDIDGYLLIGDSGCIRGNAKAMDIHIEGEIEGNVEAGNEILIFNSGKVYGDIRCRSLSIETGASFTGVCEMGLNTRPVERARPEQDDLMLDLDSPKIEVVKMK